MPTSSDEFLHIKQRFGIIGNADKLNYAIQVAVQVAGTDLSVLILGENGTGKESFSKIIHSLSHRKHGSFIAINCGAIPEGTIDSELFGHEKGAFTGATESRKGYFETVNDGTIFLDEIGEMPLSTQTRLLRLLENKEFIRVGSSKISKTNVRIIAATNVNLLAKVEEGKFREDLYYRLSTVPIHVPPLRERGLDIDILFRKFTVDFCETNRMQCPFLTKEASEVLMAYAFPGNVRQLKNIAEQICVLEVSRKIDAIILSKYLPKQSNLPSLKRETEYHDNHPHMEREILYKVLFDMKKDMVEMKKILLDLINEGSLDKETLKKHSMFFNNTNTQDELIPMLPSESRHQDEITTFDTEDVYVDTTDRDMGRTETEVEELKDTFSLEEQEKKLIEKALLKYKNRRRQAAKELGISERTLYRKIKQYDIQ